MAVVDWDVHHGNGTEACFWEDGSVLTISVHMDHRAWGHNHRQEGVPADRGAGAGLGANLNVPLPLGSGDRAYADALDRVVLPALRRVPARRDRLRRRAPTRASSIPTGGCASRWPGFHAIGERIGGGARDLGIGALAVTREGGYARTYGALCHVACLLGLLGRPLDLDDPLAYLPDVSDAHVAYVDAALAAWESGRADRAAAAT